MALSHSQDQKEVGYKGARQLPMKFVALISGGKDSFYNIHHCLSNGHELACLANLYPEDKSDEIDSFMFQTVGHDIIESYSRCVDVPLYRQAILAGGSKNQNLEYSITQNDEIEDLYALLRRIKEAHPDVEGVSCGAILSHYQRTRVESVCGRLGLTSLAYLWQRNQMDLMGEMCSNGLDARLVKVAAVGLTSKDLGKLISEMYPKLIKLNSMYEVHICGEGGEFETLVFDAPFFKKKLEIVSQEVVADTTDDVCYLKVKVAVIEKEADNESFELLPRPTLLDSEYLDVLEELELTKTEMAANSLHEKMAATALGDIELVPILSVYKNVSGKMYISNLVATGASTEEQTVSIFAHLEDILASNEVTADNIKHVTLLLSDMNEFAKVNAIYSKFFDKYFLPPSRICIGTSLPGATRVQLSCEVLPQVVRKEGIHIRSRSYWAPHNIGPYSQSIVERNPNYLAASLSGQIPLAPATMEFPERSDIQFHSVFSLQHLHRVCEVVGVKEYGSIVCFITDSANANVASEAWNESVDRKGCLIIVEVPQLPRGAAVEWGGYSYAEIENMYDDDDEDEEDEEKSEANVSKLPEDVDYVTGLIQEFDVTLTERIAGESLFNSTIFSNEAEILNNFLKQVKGKVQLYTSLTNANGLVFGNAAVEYTPVSNVWDHYGTSFKYGLVWKYYPSKKV